MINKLKSWLFTGMTLSTMLFIILFDVDGSQLGVQLWNNVPNWIVPTASILGNVVWLFGALLMFIGGAVIYAALSDDKGAIRKASKAYDTEEQRKILYRTNYLLVGISGASALFAIGSGFWFTGTGWMISLVGIWFWRKAIIKHIEELDEKNGVEKPLSAKDEMRKSLLDD